MAFVYVSPFTIDHLVIITDEAPLNLGTICTGLQWYCSEHSPHQGALRMLGWAINDGTTLIQQRQGQMSSPF